MASATIPDRDLTQTLDVLLAREDVRRDSHRHVELSLKLRAERREHVGDRDVGRHASTHGVTMSGAFTVTAPICVFTSTRTRARATLAQVLDNALPMDDAVDDAIRVVAEDDVESAHGLREVDEWPAPSRYIGSDRGAHVHERDDDLRTRASRRRLRAHRRGRRVLNHDRAHAPREDEIGRIVVRDTDERDANAADRDHVIRRNDVRQITSERREVRRHEAIGREVDHRLKVRRAAIEVVVAEGVDHEPMRLSVNRRLFVEEGRQRRCSAERITGRQRDRVRTAARSRAKYADNGRAADRDGRRARRRADPTARASRRC